MKNYDKSKYNKSSHVSPKGEEQHFNQFLTDQVLNLLFNLINQS